MDTDLDLLAAPEKAARLMDVGRSTIYELMASGELESVKIGRSRRIPVRSIERYVERLRAASAEPAA